MYAACFGLYLGHHQACQYKNVIRERRVVVGKLEGNNHLRDPSVDGRIILRWIYRK
jgi:hypothetical protein